MTHRGIALPRTCATCAHYEPVKLSRGEVRKLRREKRKTGAHRYEFAAQSFQRSAAVVAEQPAANNAPLLPGETRTVEHMRAETLGDVATYVGKGAAIGLAGLGMCVPLALLPAVPWYTPFVAFPAAAGLGIFVSVLRPREWLLSAIEDVLQRDIDGDGQVSATRYAVDGALSDGRGHDLYLKFEMEGENADLKWHNFCRAVTYQRRNFSRTEAVKRHGLAPEDWGSAYQAFIAQQWVIPAGPRGTPELLVIGKRWVKLYADTPPSKG